MRSRTKVHVLSLMGALLGLVATPALAAPLPVEATVRVGKPPRPHELEIHAEGAETQISVGRGPGARASLPVAAPEDASVEVARLAGGAAVAVIRVRGKEARAAAILATDRRGRPEFLWSGRTDLYGDPGERRGARITIDDRTGDNVPDVILSITSESHRICGQDETPLFPRAVDPASLTLRPVVLRRLPEGAAEVEVLATWQGPEGALPKPILPPLQFTAASSAAGGEPFVLPVPRQLTDGDPDTVWTEGQGGAGRWEFVTATRTGGSWPIRAIALTVVPRSGVLASRLGRPRTLWLVGDRGPRLRVTLPEDPQKAPGTPVWIHPPEPLAWRCLSVVLDAPFGSPDKAQHTALAEVAVYTAVDLGEGLGALVPLLAAPGVRGDEAADLLRALGPAALEAVQKALPGLPPAGRRRVVRIFAAAARDHAPARAALLTLARDEDEEVHRRALESLVLVHATDALGELAATAGRTGDEAALGLARTAPAAAVPSLLEATAAEGGTERPVLRRALGAAVLAAGDDARAPLASFVDAGPSAAVAAAVALALAPVEGARETAARLTRAAYPEVHDFPERYRLVLASGSLEAEPAVDAWLESVASEAEEWMLRAAALRALSTRAVPDATRRAARGALKDDYPRVRMAALEVLAGSRADLRGLATLARRDPWPMVRAAGVRAIIEDARARPVLRAAVGDRAERVRAAAIAALTELGDRQAWPRVRSRLESDKEWPQVVAAAAEYARALCVREAATALEPALERALRPNAWAPDVDAGTAVVRALVALGTEKARALLRRVDTPLGPAALRAALEAARTHGSRCPP